MDHWIGRREGGNKTPPAGRNTVVTRQPNVRADPSWEHAPDAEPDDHRADAVETRENRENLRCWIRVIFHPIPIQERTARLEA